MPAAAAPPGRYQSGKSLLNYGHIAKAVANFEGGDNCDEYHRYGRQ